jgi:hypothetical protein
MEGVYWPEGGVALHIPVALTDEPADSPVRNGDRSEPDGENEPAERPANRQSGLPQRVSARSMPDVSGTQPCRD